MAIRSKIILLIGALMSIVCWSGCASRSANDYCKNLTAPASFKVYLFVTNEYNPPAEIRNALEHNTTYALLQLNQEVKVINSAEAIGNDGILLQIDITGSLRSGMSKRIDVRYQVVNNASHEVMLKEKDAASSKLGYNKIVIKLGRNIGHRVDDMIRCIQGNGKATP